MKIHTGDSVVVITGKDKGKQGTVLRVLPQESRVVVEGLNMRTKHVKKSSDRAGQKLRYEASLHVSNVMVVDPKTKKPSRIGYRIDQKTGRKERIARKSGELLLHTKITAKSAAVNPTQHKKESKADGLRAASSRTKEGGGTAFTTAHRSQGG